MITFSEYLKNFDLKYDPVNLDICRVDQEYCITAGAGILLSPAGKKFSHETEGIMRMLATDLQLYNGSPLPPLAPPILFCYRSDILEAGQDPFPSQWNRLFEEDRIIQHKISGTALMQAINPEDSEFSFAFITLTGLMASVNDFAARIMSELVIEQEEPHPFPELIKLAYQQLAMDRKAAVQGLHFAHHCGIVLPMMMVLGEISEGEYVKSLLALKIFEPAEYVNLLASTSRIQSFLNTGLLKPIQPKAISELILEGEGDYLEFKSTLRWDIRAGKTNPAIERACLKTIAAFLNTKGGVLLIGVRDDGSIEGTETDKLANDDKFLLHLWTLIRVCLGTDLSGYIHTRMEKVDQKSVCCVECLPAERPAFLRQPGFPEELYMRVGPSSNALSISEALKYIHDRFH